MEQITARFNTVKQAECEEAIRWGLSDEEANDRGSVAAWLDYQAQRRCLRVERYRIQAPNDIVCHRVALLEKGEVVAECGGWAFAYGKTNGYFHKEELSDEWVRVVLMITDMFPEHTTFKRSNGKKVDLGFNGDDSFYAFSVVMHRDDLVDK